jgi:hypothetical protein
MSFQNSDKHQITSLTLTLMQPKTTVIYRSSQYRPKTLQTVKDEEILEIRKRKVGEEYRMIEHWLEQTLGMKLTRQKLLETANKLYEMNVVEHPPDRLCKRKKEALICWFHENLRQCNNYELMKTSVCENDFKLQRTESLRDDTEFETSTEMISEEHFEWNGDFEDYEWQN